MRRIPFLAPVFLIPLLLVVAVSAAKAQNAPSSASAAASPVTTGIAPSQSPVGHRQPKMSDLPRDLADRQKADALQDASRRAEGNIDQRLRICIGC